jgi:hypothetical protein
MAHGGRPTVPFGRSALPRTTFAVTQHPIIRIFAAFNPEPHCILVSVVWRRTLGSTTAVELLMAQRPAAGRANLHPMWTVQGRAVVRFAREPIRFRNQSVGTVTLGQHSVS